MKLMLARNVAAMAITFVSVSLGQQPTWPPKAAITYKVTDEGSAVIAGADVSVSFADSKAVEGNTDAGGVFRAEGLSNSGSLPGGVEKEGFYWSRVADPKFNLNDIKDNRWQPWNPTFVVVMKKMVNPIPLYAKRVRTELPVLKGPVGYDLMAGDWVAPHGKGVVSDMVFTGRHGWRALDDYEDGATLTFSNLEDGLQSVYDDPEEGSVLRLRTAPENGYADKKWERSFFMHPGLNKHREGERPDQCYFFRVRTVIKNGKVESANYGKIYGPIRYQPMRNGGKTSISLEFKYFLNPTAKDLNLEFDWKKNLFQQLGSNERVQEP